MLKIDFLVFFYIDTVGVKSPGLQDTFFKLSDTLLLVLAGANTDPTNTKCRTRLSFCHRPSSEDDDGIDLRMYDDFCYSDGDGNDDDMAPCPTPFLVLKVHLKFCQSTPLLAQPAIVRMIMQMII